ncbi:MAG: gamma-glutamyltransferase [Bryobacteraceae bacterium]|nr:gamma-glutamyltransferase [Bryobacteraceae bacterium]
MRLRGSICTLLAILGGAWFVRAQKAPPEQPARYAVRGMRGAVAGGSEPATDAGMRLYYAGGNAVDAGVAAMFAASIVEYSHFGFGGEAPILIRTKEGRVVSIAGVGTMPKSATADFFRRRRFLPGEVQYMEPNGVSQFVPGAGLMPALVPGMVDAGLLALREYGTKSFAEVIAPAIELADGAALDEMRAMTINSGRRFFKLWPTSEAHWIGGADRIAPGAVFRQPNLARTLRAMADAEKRAGGPRTAKIDAVRNYFYRGDVAKKIDAFVKQNGGLLRYEDMAGFKLSVEEPVSTTYRGVTVYKPGFWSQGPSMIQALNMLEAGNHHTLPYQSTESVHQLTEALKLAYADRDTYYGDPNFSKVPASILLSKEYAAERRKAIGQRAMLEFKPGMINGKVGKHPAEVEMARIKIDDSLMARDTTCINAMDASGIMFVATPSGAWLPSVIAGDTGIPLTQRAQSFFLIEGHPNELAPGKRPRVTLSPTLVTREGKAFLGLSTPGGDNQDQALLQLLLDVVDQGMNVQQAIESPRLQTRHLVSSFDNHAMNPGDLILDDRLPQKTIIELRQRGHKVSTRSKWTYDAAPVMIRLTPNGVIEAGADPYAYRTARAW